MKTEGKLCGRGISDAAFWNALIPLLAVVWFFAMILSLHEKAGHSVKNWEKPSQYRLGLLKNEPKCPVMAILSHSANTELIDCCKTRGLMRKAPPDETKALI